MLFRSVRSPASAALTGLVVLGSAFVLPTVADLLDAEFKRSFLFAHAAASFLWILTFLAPLPQDLNYHNFSDKRKFCCIPNGNDVVVRYSTPDC